MKIGNSPDGQAPTRSPGASRQNAQLDERARCLVEPTSMSGLTRQPRGEPGAFNQV